MEVISGRKFVCTFNFSGLPQRMMIRRNIRSNDSVEEGVELPVEVSCELLSDQLLSALSQMPPGSITFPEIFFDQDDAHQYRRNIKGILAILESCLLRQSGINVNERSNNAPEDDPLPEFVVPHGPSDAKGLSYNQPQLKLYEPMPTADRKVVFDQNYPNDQETGDDINQHKTLAPNYLQNETAESTVVSSTDGKISKSAAKDITDAEKTTSPTEEMEPDVAQKDKNLYSKYRHTFYHVLHGMEGSCPLVQNQSNPKCDEDYDENFAIGLEMLLDQKEEIDSIPKVNYNYYINDHFKNYCKSSPCCTRLWRYCFSNKNYSPLKYAEEGLVVFSKLREDTIGMVTDKYLEYKTAKEIGHGGFGRVYMLSTKLVVKEEYKRPLIFSNPTVFQLIGELDYKHVISLEEYVVGRVQDNNPDRRVFLSVMQYQNRRGLNEQFVNCKCILDHMIKFEDRQECIFRNYTVMYTHVFKGLEYLHSQNIMHGDVKDKNILVHQSCPCKTPLQCSCIGGSGVTYVLGDMGLFWMEKNLTKKYMEWATAKDIEPAGTKGMKAPELYFTGMQGEKCGGAEADIWAGSLTMMKALVGDEQISWSKKQFDDFFKAIGQHSNKHVDNITNAYDAAKELKTKGAATNWDEEFTDELNKVIQSLESVKRTHWISSHTYPEKLPLPFSLGVSHGANNLYQQCLDKIPKLYGTQTWEAMKQITYIINNGLRFLPGDRISASKIIEELETLQLL